VNRVSETPPQPPRNLSAFSMVRVSETPNQMGCLITASTARRRVCHRSSPRSLGVASKLQPSSPLNTRLRGSESTQNRLSALLKESVCYRVSRKRFLSKNWLKAKIRLAKQHEHIKDFRRDSLNSVFYSHRSTTFWC
jgi:hypothetical protein